MLGVLLLVASVFNIPQTPTNFETVIQLDPPLGAQEATVVIEHDYRSRFQWETIENNAEAIFTLDMRLRAGWDLKSLNGNVITSRRWNQNMFLAGECESFDGIFDGAGTSGDADDYQKLTGAVVTVNLSTLPQNKLILSNQARTITYSTASFQVIYNMENVMAGVMSQYITTAGAVITVTYQ